MSLHCQSVCGYVIKVPSVLKGCFLYLCIELPVQLVLGLEGPVVGKKEEPGTEE